MLRRRVCAAIASAPYSMKLPSSHRSAMFSRAAAALGVAPAMASGRAASSVRAWRSSTRCRSARMRPGSCAAAASARTWASPAMGSSTSSGWPWPQAAGHREQPGHAAGVRGGQHVLHLHGFEHGQLGARGHLVALGHAQLHQARGHGGHDGVGRRIGGGF
jgi:hypothetical protein